MRSLSIDGKCAGTGGRSRFFFRYFLLFIILIFCFFQISIHKICGFSIYPDEFGYWACAAQMLGWDWSGTAALGSYYSYGYSLLLLLFLRAFHDGVTAYRAAIAANMLLQCGAAGILWKIFERLSLAENAEEKRMQTVLAVGIAIFYPPWLFYMQMTMAEALLMFLYVLVCYQILRFVEKPGVAGAAFLGLSLAYMYFVHMRTVAVVIAAVLTLMLYVRHVPAARKKLAVTLLVLTTGVVCGLWMKERIMDTVYAAADAEMLAVNSYAGRLGRLQYLLTFQGIKDFFISAAGKLYYLIVASFGLLIPAVSVCLKGTGKVFRRSFSKQERELAKGSEYFCLFCLLSLIGQTLITVVTTTRPDRLDVFIYGRYSEHLLPVFMGTGLLALSETRYKIQFFVFDVILTAGLFAVIFPPALRSGLTEMRGYFASALNYLSDDWDYNVAAEFPKALFLGIFLMACMAAGIFTGKRFGKYVYALGAVLLLETILGFCLGEKYIRFFNDVDYYNLRIAEYMEAYEDPIVYLYEGGFPYIDLIQFAMQDRKVEIIRQKDAAEGALSGKGFLILDRESEYVEEMERSYKKCMESQAFVLFRTEQK